MMVRCFVGAGVATSARIAGLAKTIAADAARCGLMIVSLEKGRNPWSPTRYLIVRDHSGRDWQIRVSDHRRAGNTRHADPHFDLITMDGITGRAEAKAFLDSIVMSEAVWHERAPRRHRGC